MSTGPRITWHDAMAQIRRLWGELQLVQHVERWHVVGSMRRRASTVGDIEYLVIPKMGEDPTTMFGDPINLLWRALDLHVREHPALDKGPRWGPKQRCVYFHGFQHEFYTADADSWGSMMVIRTGPAEYSKRMVCELKQHGLRHHDGHVVDCSNTIQSVPHEDDLFARLGWSPVEPQHRR